MCACTQQLEPGLVTDLDASTGEQGHAPSQVGQLGSFAEVELCASRAQLVVEMMDALLGLFADVAMLRLGGLPVGAAGAVFRWSDVLG